MRLWGYWDEGVQTRESTLSILAQFLGYKEWLEYHKNALLPKEQQSSPVLSRRLNTVNELRRGDRLRLTWQLCSIRLHAHEDCKVLTSLNIYLM